MTHKGRSNVRYIAMLAALGVPAFLLGSYLGAETRKVLIGDSVDAVAREHHQTRILCDRLFGANSRPHIVMLYDGADLDWIGDQRNTLPRLRALGGGPVVFFETLYTNGWKPVDGTYTYKEFHRVLGAQWLLRRWGFQVVGYIHGPACRDAGMTPIDILEMIRQFNWDGVYGDNFEVGPPGSHGAAQTYDFMLRLRSLLGDGPIIHHCSVEPHYGRAPFRGSWAHLETHTLWGETNKPLTGLDDPALRYRVSQAGRSAAIGMWKPSKDLIGIDNWIPILPDLLCTYQITARAGVLERFERLYYPRWLERAAQYRADPEAFVRNAVRWPPRTATVQESNIANN